MSSGYIDILLVSTGLILGFAIVGIITALIIAGCFKLNRYIFGDQKIEAKTVKKSKNKCFKPTPGHFILTIVMVLLCPIVGIILAISLYNQQ